LICKTKPQLGQLSPKRFEYYRVLERRAHFDGYIEVDGAFYSVPLPCIGHTVIVRDEIGPGTGAFALSVLTQRGAEAHRTLLGVLDLARRYEVASVASACILAAAARSTQLSVLRDYLQRHGQLITMKQDHRLISDVDHYIVHFNTAVTKGILS
jgi:hypothetical protein